MSFVHLIIFFLIFTLIQYRIRGAIEQFSIDEKFSIDDTYQRDQPHRASVSGSDGRQSDYGHAFSHQNQSTCHLPNMNQNQAISLVDTANPINIITQTIASPPPDNQNAEQSHSMAVKQWPSITAAKRPELALTNIGARAHLNDHQRNPTVLPDAEYSPKVRDNRMFNIVLQQQKLIDKLTGGQEITNTQNFDTIDLISDHGEDERLTKDNIANVVPNVAGQSQPTSKPTIERPKRKIINIKGKSNPKKKQKLNSSDVNSAKQHKCNSCDYSTDTKQRLSSRAR